MPLVGEKRVTGSLIINIRGTHGSGKTTLVRNLMKHLLKLEELMGPKKIEGYHGVLPKTKAKLYVVGSYKNACGGCDGIQPYSLIWPRVESYAKLGHVVFEGALISNSYGNIGRDSEKYGDRYIFAFLDTPLEVCLDRIRQRRLARGDDRPLNPKNTVNKHKTVMRTIDKFRLEHGRRVVVLNYLKAEQQVLALLKE